VRKGGSPRVPVLLFLDTQGKRDHFKSGRKIEILKWWRRGGCGAGCGGE